MSQDWIVPLANPTINIMWSKSSLHLARPDLLLIEEDLSKTQPCFRLPRIRRASIAAKMASSKSGKVPKGYLVVYVGEEMKRFAIPISYLNQPSFQELLSQAEEEYGYDHPMGALTIPCNEYVFLNHKKMGFRLPGIRRASITTKMVSSKSGEVPKGYLAVYVGEEIKRFVIPISYLNQPSFQELLSQVEEEYGYDHPMGALTIPCREDVFFSVTSSFNRC
ncbi:uncharacterized protein LOC129286196 [Prosopis cineraria]|uniref:uncharacterized protein LOC129286196 n=1 Tax=Prosopis cineraria TaxID=364024 RepID=UPI00240EEA29|nr:uncharacterized protein LOC129286196 [Prosopis cineraria]